MQTLLNQLEPLQPTYVKQVNYRTVIAQIQLYNQFSDEFKDLIKQYQTPQAICGYTAPANAIVVEKYGWFDGIQMLKQNSQIRRKLIQDAMEFIHQQRQLYIHKTNHLKNNKKKTKQYLEDWVANFEISDYLRFKHIQNIFFVRNINWEYPEAMKKIANEEEERVAEEIEFKGDKYFVDYPYTKEFIKRQSFHKIPDYVYVVDILGHFVAAVQLQVNEEKLIIILETMPNNRLENDSIIEFFLSQ